MADPAAAQEQLLPENEKVLLPLVADAKLSSDEIDQDLPARGKIRLGYDDLMQYLVLQCCDGRGGETEEEEGEIAEETKINNAGGSEISEQDLNSGATKEKEEVDWREEYRTKGYVEVDADYYIRRAEMQAMLAEEWAKIDFSGLTFADDDDEMLKACTVPLGALHPRIRQPLMEEEESPSSGSLGDQGETQGCTKVVPIGDREKTEEEVDQEIIAFLRRLLGMDPKPQVIHQTFLFSQILNY
jgi:hypothetical protein